MAPHSSTLAWKTPWMEEPGRLQSMGSLSRTRLSDFPFTFHFHALEKEMATYSSVPVWRIPGTGEPGELPSMGSHRVGHDWSDLAAAAAAWTPMYSSGLWVFFHFSNSSFLPLHPLMVGGSFICPDYYKHGLWGASPSTFMSLSFQLSLLSQIQRFLSTVNLLQGKWVTESLVSSRNSLFIKRHFLATQNNII